MIYIIARLEALGHILKRGLCRHAWSTPNLTINPKSDYISRCSKCGAIHIGANGTAPKYGFWNAAKKQPRKKNRNLFAYLK